VVEIFLFLATDCAEGFDHEGREGHEEKQPQRTERAQRNIATKRHELTRISTNLLPRKGTKNTKGTKKRPKKSAL